MSDIVPHPNPQVESLLQSYGANRKRIEQLETLLRALIDASDGITSAIDSNQTPEPALQKLVAATSAADKAIGNPAPIRTLADAQVLSLMEQDGHEVYFHGTVAAPFWVSDATTEAYKIFRSVVDAHDEEEDPWDYDHVLDAFRKAGWTVLNASKFWEHQVYDTPLGDDLCDICSTSGVTAGRTTPCDKTIGVECGCDRTCEDGKCANPDCEDCK